MSDSDTFAVFYRDASTPSDTHLSECHTEREVPENDRVLQDARNCQWCQHYSFLRPWKYLYIYMDMDYWTLSLTSLRRHLFLL